VIAWTDSADALMSATPATCLSPLCGKPTWNGAPGGFCTKQCRNHMALALQSLQNPQAAAPLAGTFAKCARPGCPCTASWNGLSGTYCCRTCAAGAPCPSNAHTVPSAPAAAPQPSPGPAAGSGFAKCANPQCPCTASFSGLQDDYCCKSCRRGLPCSANVHTAPLAPRALPAAIAYSKCASVQCPCTASFSGGPYDYCCKSCRRGIPCTWNAHSKPQAPARPGANLCLSGCGKATFNGQAAEFCGKACRQTYAKKAAAASLTDFGALKFMAGQWLRSAWPAALGRVNKFYRNPGLGDGACPAAGKFQRGAQALGLANLSSTEFAFHGTATLANVQSICWNGFDPTLRSGQSYGPGEYFSVDAGTSAAYAGNCGYLVVCLLLTGPHKTTHSNVVRVVNSPASGDPMYCVPVGVVDYGASADPQLQGTSP